MAMEAGDLLTILDVIRNEDLYKERLETLQRAQQALAEAKYVNVTMEQASKTLEDARWLAEQQELEFSIRKDELEAKYQAALKILEEKESEVTKQMTLLDTKLSFVEHNTNLVKTLVAENEARSEVLNAKTVELNQREKSLDTQRDRIRDLQLQTKELWSKGV